MESLCLSKRESPEPSLNNVYNTYQNTNALGLEGHFTGQQRMD